MSAETSSYLLKIHNLVKIFIDQNLFKNIIQHNILNTKIDIRHIMNTFYSNSSPVLLVFFDFFYKKKSKKTRSAGDEFAFYFLACLTTLYYISNQVISNQYSDFLQITIIYNKLLLSIDRKQKKTHFSTGP